MTAQAKSRKRRRKVLTAKRRKRTFESWHKFQWAGCWPCSQPHLCQPEYRKYLRTRP